MEEGGRHALLRRSEWIPVECLFGVNNDSYSMSHVNWVSNTIDWDCLHFLNAYALIKIGLKRYLMEYLCTYR